MCACEQHIRALCNCHSAALQRGVQHICIPPDRSWCGDTGSTNTGPDKLARHRWGEANERIVGVGEYDGVAGLLMAADFGFRGDICIHRAVAVEMIRVDVGNCCNCRTKPGCAEAFEDKRRQLEDDWRVGADKRQLCQCRNTHVAGENRVGAPCFQ